MTTNLTSVPYLSRLGLWAGVPAPALAMATYCLMLAVLWAGFR